MKNVLTLLAILFAVQIGISQITFSPEIYDIDLTTESEKKFGFTMENVTDTVFTFHWSIDLPNGFPAEWTFQVCDTQLCYDFGMNKNAETKPNILEPGQVTNPEKQYVNVLSNGVPGKSFVIFNVYRKANCRDLIYSTQPNLTSSDDIALRPIVLYPNPTSDQISIRNDEGITKVDIQSFDGRSVYTSAHQEGQSHNVNFIPSGSYIVRLMGVDNRLTRLQKVVIK